MADSKEFDSIRKELVNPDNRIRYDAVLILEERGGPESVQLLIGALRDQEYVSIRWRAARALGKLRAQEAVEALVAALGDESQHVRKGVAQALGEIGDPSAVPALIEALRDDERKVGLEASHALRDIGPPALATLRQAEATSTGGMKEALSEVIGEIEDRIQRRGIKE
ncbi:MAG: HEAT repeat domain-containing protein [Methanoregulaceae archaeon]|nr:HEAT repeat domain-containing protein [Methanoregulaceae archaeon]